MGWERIICDPARVWRAPGTRGGKDTREIIAKDKGLKGKELKGKRLRVKEEGGQKGLRICCASARLAAQTADIEPGFVSFITDEKKQYDPSGFRDAILEGLNEAGDDLEAVSKFLDVQSSKLDYRRYGVTLIEILVAGGLLGEETHTRNTRQIES